MSDAPSEEHLDPVVVATYVDVGEAQVAQAKLRAFGIESVILDQFEGGILPTIELSPGIGVEVKAADADDATRILSDSAEI
jgi:hypothetical protein